MPMLLIRPAAQAGQVKCHSSSLRGGGGDMRKAYETPWGLPRTPGTWATTTIIDTVTRFKSSNTPLDTFHLFFFLMFDLDDVSLHKDATGYFHSSPLAA